MSFNDMLCAAISSEISRQLESIRSFFELYPQLPEIAVTGEIAAQFRVSDDVVRRMCADGMPHVHAGRELRFPKNLIVEWSQTGKIFPCEICAEKSVKLSSPEPFERRDAFSPNAQPPVKISDKTNTKLSKLAG